MNMVKSKTQYHVSRDVHHMCVLSMPKRNWQVTPANIHDLRELGCSVDQFSIECFAICHVMGIHFRAGEWGSYPRCGSVVTCVVKGQSLYARVKQFLTVQDDPCPGYACVEWFGRPQYPCGTPLVVKVCEDTDGNFDALYGSIIRITDIDPSRVMVEYTNEPDTYQVMRESGFDTVASIV